MRLKFRCFRLPAACRDWFSLGVLTLFVALFSAAASDGVKAKDLSAKNIVVAKQDEQVLLENDEELAHPIIKGGVGPWASASVILIQVADPNKFQFKGRVAVERDGTLKTHLLPIPENIGAVMEQHVKAVMFRSVGKSSEKAIIILYEFHRSGSANDDGDGAYVFRWNGQGFVADEQVRKKLFGAKNSKEVDRRLTKIKGKQ